MQTLSSAEGQPFKSTLDYQSGTVRYVEVHIYEMILDFIYKGTGHDILQSAKALQTTGCPFLHIKDYQDNYYEVVGGETGIELLEVVDKDGNKFEVQPYDEDEDPDNPTGIVWQEEFFNRYIFSPMK